MDDGYEFYDACWCAGPCCGGHVRLGSATVPVTPIRWHGAAQHTWTMGCDGFHSSGPCPPSQQQVRVEPGG